MRGNSYRPEGVAPLKTALTALQRLNIDELSPARGALSSPFSGGNAYANNFEIDSNKQV